jgi:hypothetical protein
LERQFNPMKYTLRRWYAEPTTTASPTGADSGAGGSGA